MGHRSLNLILCACLALSSSGVWALGLGKINLESALNQPLRAEIELLEMRELHENEILISIASREDFDRVGVDKAFFLSDLKFKVVLTGAKGPVVQISSSKLVREPFLNFIVEAQWPSGKLLREYTLLIDLPVFSQQPSQSVQSVVSQQAPSDRPASAAPQSATSDYKPRSAFVSPNASGSSASSSNQTSTGPAYTGDTYKVSANDTLWEIAAQVRPDRSVSIQQTMLAIQRDNPQAFINNNINLLKKGQVLRIPSRDALTSVYDSENAVREVAAQNADWSGSSSGADVSAAQLTSGRSYGDESSQPDAREGRLKLASPDKLYASNEGRSTGGSAEASTDALENELAITLEQFDKSSKDNNELRSKVQSLEEQIETMERMISVSNESLRALELSVKKNADEAALSASTESDDEDVYSSTGSDSDSDSDSGADSGADAEQADVDDEAPLVSDLGEELAVGTDSNAEGETRDSVDSATTEDVAAVSPQDKSEATVDRRKVVLKAPVPEKGIIDLILDYVVFIVIGVIGVGVGVGVFFFIRQRSADEDDFDFGDEELEVVEQNSEPLLEEQEDSHEIDLGDFDDSFAEDLDEPLEESEARLDAEPETEDVVAEADIYIAYGKYEQAEEMLLTALSRKPNDEDARLKLLEVYSSQGDAERFDPHFAKLRAFASSDTLARATQLRSSIDGAPDFDEGSFDVSDVPHLASSDQGDALDEL
ncbi:MAG: pilus assembly protein FimV, partial [Lentisphaeria bacterium]